MNDRELERLEVEATPWRGARVRVRQGGAPIFICSTGRHHASQSSQRRNPWHGDYEETYQRAARGNTRHLSE